MTFSRLTILTGENRHSRNPQSPGRRGTFIPVFCWMFLLLFPGTSLYAEIPNPLVVACVPDIFPISFLNEEGLPDGVFPRIIEEIAGENGITLEWSIASWSDNLQKAKNGEIDLMIALIYTPERDEFLDYGNEFVLSTWSQVFQRKEGLLESILDVEGKRIGMVYGDQNARGFIALADSFNLHYQSEYYNSFDDIFEGLQTGHLDAGIFYNLYSLSHPEMIATSIIYQPTHSYFAIPQGADGDILNLIDRNLKAWKADENSFYYTNVLSLLSDSGPVSLPNWLKILLPSLLAFIISILLWSWMLKRQVRQRTAALLNAQEDYRSTFTEADVGIFHIDAEGFFLRVNPGFCRNLGYTEQALLDMNIIDIIFPEDWNDEILKDLRQNRRSSIHTELRYVSLSGKMHWGHLNLTVVRKSNGSPRYLVGIIEDVTARKNAENLIDDLQKRYRGIFDNSYQMTALFDKYGRLLDLNDTMKAFLGSNQNLEDLRGKSLSDIEMFGVIGSLRIAEMVDNCLSTGQIIRHVIGFEETNGEIAVEVTVKPITDKDGNIRYCISEAHDISDLLKLTNSLEQRVEERTREIAAAQTQLIQADKLASMGRLVAGIAHEINTPIGVAKTGVSFLGEQVHDALKKYEEGSLEKNDFFDTLTSLKEVSGILEQSLDKAIKLIKDFKMISANEFNYEIRRVPVKKYMEAVMHRFNSRFKQKHISWSVTAPEEELNLHVGVLNQLLVNLSLNVLNHAYPSGETGRITIEYQRINNERILWFRDDGCGIPSSIINRIYEPFFTTNRGEGNTGLGLSIVYNLVKDVLKGEIECQSEEGKGTVFRISLSEFDND